MNKKLPGVSVVIPSFNDKKKVFRLLNSLEKSTYSNLETIVVVNGPKDTLDEGEKKYLWVKWIDAGGDNIGQTGCYNLGFAYTKKENHILYCDSDVVLDKDMISNLVKATQSNKKIGIVTPMILYLSDKNFVNQAGAEVNLITGQVKVGWGSKEKFLEGHEVQNSGTLMLFKRDVVNKIGGVDNWFLCYFDPDYCLRAKREGFITWYEPSAKCFHDQSKDPNIWRPRVLSRAYLLGRNRVLFMRRHGNMLTFILFLPLILGYYFIETLRYNNFHKFLELLWGTLVGFFYPLKSANFIPLPRVKKV
ncbi:MAG: glycosyltransferase family 2 protein [Candidatus Daviesbacteria bacterium]|nr:glycosyltransferase family 2 protein [Candidatus Daviesbacteria bacterium]